MSQYHDDVDIKIYLKNTLSYQDKIKLLKPKIILNKIIE